MAVVAQQFGCTGQRFGDSRVETPHHWQKLPPHADSSKCLVFVHFVVAKVYPASAAESFCIATSGPCEKRPRQHPFARGVQQTHRFYSAHTISSASAQQI